MESYASRIGSYPQVSFWNRNAAKLRVINPEEFRRDELLELIGLGELTLADSFGVTELEEIKRRQEILRFMLEYRDFAKFVQSIGTDFAVPLNSQKFLDHYGAPENPFWKNVELFCLHADLRPELCPELTELARYMRGVRIELEAAEAAMAQDVAREVQKSSYISGIITVCVRPDSEDTYESTFMSGAESFGYRKYSFSLKAKWEEEGNDPSRRDPEWFWGAYAAFLKWFRRKHVYSPLALRKFPEVVWQDVRKYLVSVLRANREALWERAWGFDMKVSFRYDGKGLQMRIMNVLAESINDDEMSEFLAKKEPQYPGYGKVEQDRIFARSREIIARQRSVDRETAAFETLQLLRAVLPKETGREGVIIESPKTDKEFKWFAVEYMLLARHAELYGRVAEVRQRFGETIATLRDVAQLSDALERKCAEWKVKMTFPEMLGDDRHIIEFDSLLPVHLIPKTDPEDMEKTAKAAAKAVRRLVEIRSLPALNGQIIGLTGQNAGGKSVTLETIIGAVYLAQSGLPVFGENVRMNVKDVIGMVFIERGRGSTVDLLLEKLGRMEKAVRTEKDNKIVLFIDELGSATDLEGGFDIGKGLLREFKLGGCSMMFSTQLPPLAEYVVEELGGAIYQFDLDHRITPGIGRGGAKNLLKRHGLEHILNAKNA